VNTLSVEVLVLGIQHSPRGRRNCARCHGKKEQSTIPFRTDCAPVKSSRLPFRKQGLEGGTQVFRGRGNLGNHKKAIVRLCEVGGLVVEE